MNLFTISAGQIASTVWSNTIRNLSTDQLGLLNTDQFDAATPVSAAVQNTYGTYVQLNASIAHDCRGFILSVSSGAVKAMRIQLATGAAGSEVVKVTIPINFAQSGVTLPIYIPTDVGLIVKGNRVAINCANTTDAVAVTLTTSVCIIEANN